MSAIIIQHSCVLTGGEGDATAYVRNLFNVPVARLMSLKVSIGLDAWKNGERGSVGATESCARSREVE